MELAPIHLFSDIFDHLTDTERGRCAICCGGARYS